MSALLQPIDCILGDNPAAQLLGKVSHQLTFRVMSFWLTLDRIKDNWRGGDCLVNPFPIEFRHFRLHQFDPLWMRHLTHRPRTSTTSFTMNARLTRLLMTSRAGILQYETPINLLPRHFPLLFASSDFELNFQQHYTNFNLDFGSTVVFTARGKAYSPGKLYGHTVALRTVRKQQHEALSGAALFASKRALHLG
jgi:hypothetical protein